MNFRLTPKYNTLFSYESHDTILHDRDGVRLEDHLLPANGQRATANVQSEKNNLLCKHCSVELCSDCDDIVNVKCQICIHKQSKDKLFWSRCEQRDWMAKFEIAQKELKKRDVKIQELEARLDDQKKEHDKNIERLNDEKRRLEMKSNKYAGSHLSIVRRLCSTIRSLRMVIKSSFVKLFGDVVNSRVRFEVKEGRRLALNLHHYIGENHEQLVKIYDD